MNSGPTPNAPTSIEQSVAIRVMIVDDEEMLRDALRDLLLDLDFDVVGEAVDGQDGVDKAMTLRPEVVLMDLRMPRMDGIAATRQIRGILPMVQVVLHSAYDDAALRQAARECGAHTYLLKGCTAEAIEAAIVEAAARGGRCA